MTPVGVSTPLLSVHLIAAAIWVGGLVTIFVVARAASATLERSDRITYFRSLGRSYGIVGTIALLVGLATGAALLEGHPWDGLKTSTAVVAGALLVVTGFGMAQARAMTRLRRQALDTPRLADRVRRGAISAGLLRGAIGALTLALVVLGAALAS